MFQKEGEPAFDGKEGGGGDVEERGEGTPGQRNGVSEGLELSCPG